MTVRTPALFVLVGLMCTHGASVSTQSPTPSYLITDLGTLGGAQSEALAINELAQVVGGAQRSDGTTHAFFFDGSTVRDLGTIGGPNSVATGVNDRGQIVGRSDSVIGNVKGFVITNGVRRSLGTLGGSHIAANAISPLGDVVGSATTTNNRPNTVHSFHIVPAVVAVPTTVTISATYGLVTISQTLTVIPPALKLIGVSRGTITGSCQTSTAKVTLTGPAPAAGARVELSTTTSGVHIPGAVTVAPGQTSATIIITGDAVHALTSGVFAASYGGVSKQLALSVRPILLTAVTLTPSAVTGGSSVSGAASIVCAAPSGGLTATLTSTKAAVAAPPTTSVTFAAGTTAVAFAVLTNKVTVVTTLAIRVAANGVTKGAPLTVTP